ncbi:hypothetical protein HY604_01905 [Candidatus Peregrinibacteria bacterium]|nr:hypothetical protein [Candidatus Peregrinibacteria bacterium]
MPSLETPSIRTYDEIHQVSLEDRLIDLFLKTGIHQAISKLLSSYCLGPWAIIAAKDHNMPDSTVGVGNRANAIAFPKNFSTPLGYNDPKFFGELDKDSIDGALERVLGSVDLTEVNLEESAVFNVRVLSHNSILHIGRIESAPKKRADLEHLQLLTGGHRFPKDIAALRWKRESESRVRPEFLPPASIKKVHAFVLEDSELYNPTHHRNERIELKDIISAIRKKIKRSSAQSKL